MLIPLLLRHWRYLLSEKVLPHLRIESAGLVYTVVPVLSLVDGSDALEDSPS